MKWLFLLLLPMAAIGQPINFAWDNAPTNPAGTTTELVVNSISYTGLVGNTTTIDVPISPGQNIDAIARAIPPEGYQCGNPLVLCPPSIWSNRVLVTIPMNPENVYATKTWTGLDNFVIDNFNRANETPLTGNWYNKTGINLSSNKVVSTTNSDKFAVRKTPQFTANQFSEIKLIATPGYDFGVAVRCSSTQLTGYWLTPYSNGSSISISKFNNGSYSILSTVSAITKINDMLKLEIVGNVLKGYVNNNLVITTTDNNPITTGQPGLFMYDTSTLDDWKGGNL